MPEDFEALAEEILADLKMTGEQFWQELNDNNRPIVEQAARDLAKYSLRLITKPELAEQTKRDIGFIRSTLESEATLVALQVEKRLKASLMSGLRKLVGLGIGLL